MDLEFKETPMGTPPNLPKAGEVRLEAITGYFPRVSAAPTWMPRGFMDSFARYKNGATRRLYMYDFETNTWHYASLT